MRKVVTKDPARALFDAIGRFLADQRLDSGPGNYAFAHRILSAPAGPLARTVAALTEGGVRLSERDVAALGGQTVETDAPTSVRAADLVAQTRSQMHDFTGLMDRLRIETSGFGRDLAASVDGIDAAAAPEIVRLTASMLARVAATEARLEAATTEADTLRQALEQAQVDARSDTLTALPNRRALTEEFERRRTAGTALCVALCDIDHFKAINDRLGHAVGDRVLCAIAGTLADSCRGAFVARYGGEEFALLFDGSDAIGVAEALDRARATVAAKRYRSRDDATPVGTVTFSGGVVAVGATETLPDAIARADALLYGAKEAGRNRIAR